MPQNRVEKLISKEAENISKRADWLDALKLKLKEKASVKVFISGICGTGTSAVASLLKKHGFQILGSDKAFYPPMGEVVKELADKLYEGYSADNLDCAPDFVVIGNSISKDNPEFQRVLEDEIPHASMPEVFGKFLIGDREECQNSVVISGTHGKTTTTAMLSVLLEESGRKPGYFVGGFVEQLSGGLELPGASLAAEDKIVVLEGDEYDSALFAKWSKFHSYRPDYLVITSLEFDHADIFSSIDDIKDEFVSLVKTMPKNSYVFIADTYPLLLELKKSWEESDEIKSNILSYGESSDSDFQLLSRETGSFGQNLSFLLEGQEIQVKTQLSGKQNALNLLAVSAAATKLGLSQKEISQNLQKFKGVKKRQQKVFEDKCSLIIEDFAHHPTAVKLTLAGLKESHPNKKLIAIFEPRSNTSRRDFFQKEYATSFDAADLVIIKEVEDASGYSKNKTETKKLDSSLLAKEIGEARENKNAAISISMVSDILSEALKIREHLKDGSQALFVIMSNGDFGGLKKDLVERFKSF